MFDKRDSGLNRFFTGLARNRFNNATAARGLDGEFLIGMTLAFVVVFFLWWTPFLFPFRIFTTAVHEVSHAIASIAMSGSSGNIQLFWNGGGVTQVAIGGTISAIVIFSAGYLGTVMFGGFLLLASKRANMRRQLLWAITAGLGLMTVMFIRDVTSLLLVLISGGLVGLVAYKGPDIVVTFTVYVLALMSCLNSVMDLFWLITGLTNPFHTGFNDAIGLARYTGIPAIFWAGAWGLLGAFMMFYFVSRSIRRSGALTPEIKPASSSPFAKFGFGTPKSNGKTNHSAASNGKEDVSPFDRYDDYLSKK